VGPSSISRRLFTAGLCASALPVSPAFAAARKRICALSIANNYAGTGFPLTSPRNDAGKVIGEAQRLPKAWAADPILDADLDALRGKLGRFMKTAEDFDPSIVLFHYSGHGIQFEGRNYFLLGDGKTLVSFDDLLRRMMSSGRNPRFLVAFLDCCRDNPFDVSDEDSELFHVDDVFEGERRIFRVKDVARSSGMKKMELGRAMVGFATQPDWAAADGVGADGLSPYSRAVADHLREALSVSDLFAKITDDVRRRRPEDNRYLKQEPSVFGTPESVYLAGYPRAPGASFLP